VPNLALRLQAPRLDRIVRGRAWIPLLGVSLVAIVGLRVEVLRLGSAVGSQVQQAAVLASGNSQLRAEISALSDNQRIESLAGQYGMRMPTPLDLHFLRGSSGRDAAAAIRNITPPSRSTFLSGLAAERQNNLLKAAANSTLSAIGGPANSLSTTTTLGTASLSSAPTGVSTASTTGLGQGTGASGAVTSSGTVAGAGTVGGTSSGTAAGGVSSSSTTAASASGAPAPPTSATDTSTGVAGSGSGVASQSTLTGTPNAAGAAPTTGSSNGGTSLSG
jgi:cell division protein FtsL